ncbi:MAG: glycosyltransferase family 4 protein [Bacteroidales bacterium]|nr:glycosyltransferase family 4 protein [Bacteroidales bacterium]
MTWWTYLIIALLLVIAELVYFRVADHFNIIDKPDERSLHTKVVLRGGGIIFSIGLWIWSAFFGFQYIWLLVAVTLAAGVSFVDDVRSLPNSVRLVVQFAAMGLLFYGMNVQGVLWGQQLAWGWQLLVGMVALIVCVGVTNIYNFMDGINGITAGYSLSVLIPLALLNGYGNQELQAGFVDQSLMVVTILSVLVFSVFNFRPKNMAKCFAGDVGSVGMAFILLFLIGCLVLKTGDVTWLAFLLVYGVDGGCTIVHRIMLHENLGKAHRKHAYQLMANELKIGHVTVSLIYMALQLVISLVMVYLIPNTPQAHWIYLLGVGMVLVGAYVLFMKKFYHLHAAYLASLDECQKTNDARP